MWRQGDKCQTGGGGWSGAGQLNRRLLIWSVLFRWKTQSLSGSAVGGKVGANVLVLNTCSCKNRPAGVSCCCDQLSLCNTESVQRERRGGGPPVKSNAVDGFCLGLLQSDKSCWAVGHFYFLNSSVLWKEAKTYAEALILTEYISDLLIPMMFDETWIFHRDLKIFQNKLRRILTYASCFYLYRASGDNWSPWFVCLLKRNQYRRICKTKNINVALVLHMYFFPLLSSLPV